MGHSMEDLQEPTPTKKGHNLDSFWTERRKESCHRRRRSPSSSSSSSSSSSDSVYRKKSPGSPSSRISSRKWTSNEPRSESNRSSMNEAYLSSTEVLNHTTVSQEDLPSSNHPLGNLDKARTNAEAKEAIVKSAHEEATDSDDGSQASVSKTQPPTPDMRHLQRHLDFTPAGSSSEEPHKPKRFKRMKSDESRLERTSSLHATSSDGHSVVCVWPPSRSEVDSVPSPSFAVPFDRRPSSSPQVRWCVLFATKANGETGPYNAWHICCLTPTQYSQAGRGQLDSFRRRSVATDGSPQLPSLIQRSLSDVIATSAANVQCRIRRKSYSLVDYDVTEFGTADHLGFIDTHCHLDFLFKRLDMNLNLYRPYRKYFDYLYPKSYEGCVAIFCDPKTFGKRELWSSVLNEPNVWAAFGCHPHMARQYDDEVEARLREALRHKKVVALGEIGLDYSHKNSCDREVQKAVFKRQLSIANETKLPLVIHSRDSTEDTLAILKKEISRDHMIHRHCFTGDWSEALVWLNTFPNLYIGLTALCTYQTATPVHEVAREINLSRLLLETDAPYFLPRHANKTEKWSHPGMAIHVASQIAALRNDAMLEDVIKQTRLNTTALFGI